jgi:hypothetical protein
LRAPTGQAATPGPVLGLHRQRDPQRGAVREREQDRGRRHPRLAAQILGKLRREPLGGHQVGGVTVVERRRRHPLGSLRQQHAGAAVDGDRPVVERDTLDDGESLRVVGAHGEPDGDRRRRVVRDLHDREVAGHGVDPLDGVAPGDAHRRLHDRRVVDERLPHRRLTRREVPAILGADPPVQRPTVEPRREQAAGIDDRLVLGGDGADRGPVAQRHVRQDREMPAGNERRAAGVELALEPVRPDPVDAELRGGARPHGAEHGAGADGQQLGRHLDLDGLAEALERREVADGVVRDAQPPHQPAQRPRFEAHGAAMPCSSAFDCRPIRAGMTSAARLPL